MPIVDRAVWRLCTGAPSALLRRLAHFDPPHTLFRLVTEDAQGTVFDRACGSWRSGSTLPYEECALAAAHRGVRPPYVLFDPDRRYMKEHADARR